MAKFEKKFVPYWQYRMDEVCTLLAILPGTLLADTRVRWVFLILFMVKNGILLH